MASGNVKVQHSMQGAFIFVLLGLFALMSTLMVLLGAQMYRATVDRSQANNEDRVLGAYVRSMVRSGDTGGSVTVEQVDGHNVVAIREILDDEPYVTWLYQYEGELYEDYSAEEYGLQMGDGVAVCAANSLEASLDGSLLTVRMTDGNDKPCTVQVALKCVG